MDQIEQITDHDKIIAFIIRSEYSRDGLQFFTPDDFSQQLGYMKRPGGHRIAEHVHRLQAREVKYTQETVFVRSGRVRVDFYADDRSYLTSRELGKGDVMLLASGGHGFLFLEEAELIEVKQGPYCGDRDKITFEGHQP
ncbi:MAG: hypothetical protein HYX91_01725 [Chloroflexi bacterium]|nr:hypothetical protein [Chloroflexota bacterium]